MRIIAERRIRNYYTKNPAAEAMLRDWVSKVRKAAWRNFADMKASFNSVDSVGGQRYVFNIKGNSYRMVVVVKFTPQFVLIKFIGTHKEYDKIDCRTVEQHDYD